MFMRQGGTHACHSQACASPESANRSGLTPLTYLLATYLLHAIDGLASRVLCIMHSSRFFVVGDTESESVPTQTHSFIGRSGGVNEAFVLLILEPYVRELRRFPVTLALEMIPLPFLTRQQGQNYVRSRSYCLQLNVLIITQRTSISRMMNT